MELISTEEKGFRYVGNPVGRVSHSGDSFNEPHVRSLAPESPIVIVSQCS